jgi:AcrR family transcriptional regulator
MDQTPATRRAPRRDAQHRREALLSAAAVCFGEQGYDVPMEVIADRAGVGRGTLYRNFKDREALALAIFSREIERFEQAFDPAAPIEDTLGRMVRDAAPVMALYRRIAVELRRHDANVAALQELGERLQRIIAPAVAQAQGRGEFRATLGPQDFLLAMKMAGGLLFPFMSEDEVREQVSAAMTLLFAGLRPH